MTIARKQVRLMGLMALLGICVLVCTTRAQEVDVPLSQVPKAVMDSAKAKFPSATIREASKETSGGKTVFELALTDERRKMDVTFLENGTLIVVETETSAKELPASALIAVKTKYPNAKIGLVESVKKGPELKSRADYFEVHFTTAAQKSVEVEVNGQGKILKVEENSGKDND